MLGYYTSVQIADLIEPKKGNDIATLTINDDFFIIIKTPLREGEHYTVHFSAEDIVYIIEERQTIKSALLENLVNYLSEPLNIGEIALSKIEASLKICEYIDRDADFSAMINDKVDEKMFANLAEEVTRIMADYHCQMLNGKATFLDKQGVVYTQASLIQLFSGKSNQIAIKHPITKQITRYNPAKVYLDEKIYEIYNGTVFYPASYSGDKFNTFNDFEKQKEKLMYISPFINYVNQTGCAGDKKTTLAFWSFFAKIVQGNVNKYSAIAIVSHEDELVDLLLKGFRTVLEQYYFRVTNKKQLTGVNTSFEDKLLVEIDDEFIADKGAMITFEDLVKKTNFPYQVKNGLYETKPNYTSCITISKNHEFVSKLAKKKMLIVVEVSSERADDYEYLDTIQKMIDDPRFAPSLMMYLSKFNYMKHENILIRPPVKELSNEEIEEGFSTETRWFYERLKSGEIINVPANTLNDGWVRFGSKELHNDFITYAKSIGKPSKTNSSGLGTKISQILKPVNLIKASQKLKEGINGVDYGPLSECRKAFEKYTCLKNPHWLGNAWKVTNS